MNKHQARREALTRVAWELEGALDSGLGTPEPGTAIETPEDAMMVRRAIWDIINELRRKLERAQVAG